MLPLPLPELELAHVRLRYDSQTCYADPDAGQVHSDTWVPLESAVQQPSDSPLTWLDGELTGPTHTVGQQLAAKRWARHATAAPCHRAAAWPH